MILTTHKRAVKDVQTSLYIPANTTHGPNVVSMLVNCLRRWPNITPFKSEFAIVIFIYYKIVFADCNSVPQSHLAESRQTGRPVQQTTWKLKGRSGQTAVTILTRKANLTALSCKAKRQYLRYCLLALHGRDSYLPLHGIISFVHTQMEVSIWDIRMRFIETTQERHCHVNMWCNVYILFVQR